MKKSREAMGAFTPLSHNICMPPPHPRDTLPSVFCGYSTSTLRSLTVVSPHSTACTIFPQAQLASFTFHVDGHGAGQRPFPGGGKGYGNRKKTEQR